jgi:hypothetical protein
LRNQARRSISINHVTPIERRVQDKQGRFYLLRLRPYKSGDNRIDGAVIAVRSRCRQAVSVSA